MRKERRRRRAGNSRMSDTVTVGKTKKTPRLAVFLTRDELGVAATLGSMTVRARAMVGFTKGQPTSRALSVAHGGRLAR